MSEPDAPSLPQDINTTLENLPFHRTPYDRQLTRTTIKLSPEAFEARDQIAEHHKISMADALALGANLLQVLDKKLITSFSTRAAARDVRRTVAISNGALRAIEDKAKETGSHRDEVLEAILQIWRELTSDKAEVIAKRHDEILPILEGVSDALYEAEDKMKETLDTEDPVMVRFGYLIVMMDNLLHAISEELSDGTPVNPNEF